MENYVFSNILKAKKKKIIIKIINLIQFHKNFAKLFTKKTKNPVCSFLSKVNILAKFIKKKYFKVSRTDNLKT